MPISHVFAEGIGPFKKLHLDLRGEDGKPSLGPHILAGVNGSGKSTILKAIAWCLAQSEGGYPGERWVHFLTGHAVSRVLLVIESEGDRYTVGVTGDRRDVHKLRLKEWVNETLAAAQLVPEDFPYRGVVPGPVTNVATYSSARFEAWAENDPTQAWLKDLCSKRAIAEERLESASPYKTPLNDLERGLTRVCGESVSIEIEIEPIFQPRLRIGGQVLNLWQIPDGLKATLGWMADFLRHGKGLGPGLLLFDEIEGFLHPLWQRRILPALRAALPETQSIVTSHSPFVISSCAESIIHVLKVHQDGSAFAEPPMKAPIGESITSTLKDIFGVDSRFDVETEKQLNEWNELNKGRADGNLGPKDETRLAELTGVLSSRSEELRSIVRQPAALPKATIDSLTETPRAGRVRRRVATH